MPSIKTQYSRPWLDNNYARPPLSNLKLSIAARLLLHARILQICQMKLSSEQPKKIGPPVD
jgi:uncharacterized Rossmann fold enzyme